MHHLVTTLEHLVQFKHQAVDSSFLAEMNSTLCSPLSMPRFRSPIKPFPEDRVFDMAHSGVDNGALNPTVKTYNLDCLREPLQTLLNKLRSRLQYFFHRHSRTMKWQISLNIDIGGPAAPMSSFASISFTVLPSLSSARSLPKWLVCGSQNSVLIYHYLTSCVHFTSFLFFGFSW